ncbi:MAG: methyltransferase domain-containing protein [Myxococcota bacterium]
MTVDADSHDRSNDSSDSSHDRSPPGSEGATRRYYDDFSERYERGRRKGYHALIDELEFEVLRPLVEGRRVLEVGCGTGLILERLRPLAGELQGIDLSPGMLEKARARGFDVTEGNVTALPFDDATFDVVCSFKVLAHVPDIGKALAEIARVTKPGGHMVLEFYNPWSLRFLAKRLGRPGSISERRTEADVYTRWDSPLVIRRILPPGVELIDYRGVRVLTPTAALHRLPAVGSALRFLERRALTSRLRYLGGFLVAILRKQH